MEAYSLEIIEGLEPVRKRPGMYIGDTRDGSALHRLVREFVLLGVVDHREHQCFRIAVTLHRSGTVTIEDDGPGWLLEPVAVGPEERLPGIDVLATRLGHGSSFWTRGWFLACANAVGDMLFVEIRRQGVLYARTYCRGLPVAPGEWSTTAERTGTRFAFRPDPAIFENPRFDSRRIATMLRELAFLNPGLEFHFTDERSGRHDAFHGRGIGAWVSLLSEGQSALTDEPVWLRGAHGGWSLQAALRWTRHSHMRMWGYVNLETAPWGVHIEGLLEGLGQALKRAALVQGMDIRTWDPMRLRRGLVAVIEMRGEGLELEGACRNELRGTTLKTDIRRIVCERFTAYLEPRGALFGELCELTGLTGHL